MFWGGSKVKKRSTNTQNQHILKRTKLIVAQTLELCEGFGEITLKKKPNKCRTSLGNLKNEGWYQGNRYRCGNFGNCALPIGETQEKDHLS